VLALVGGLVLLRYLLSPRRHSKGGPVNPHFCRYYKVDVSDLHTGKGLPEAPCEVCDTPSQTVIVVESYTDDRPIRVNRCDDHLWQRGLAPA
jgi:hypothetical protein